MNIPISVGVSDASAQAPFSGGPFDVQMDIVFGNSGWNSGGGAGGGYAGYSAYDPYAPTATQTPTAAATGQGPANANAPGGIAGGSLLAGSSTPVYLWIALAAAGGLGLWLMMKKH